MARVTTLDKSWQDLMSLCGMEKELRTTNRHPKLLRHVSDEIDRLASGMGFSARQIVSREFRAVKNGDHIVRVIIEPAATGTKGTEGTD
jgi:hypothetical protein